MSTLLLRFAAPLQSWGASSRFQTRLTGREPTKSGVIGMLAAALGRRRTDSLADLCALNFGVRIDQPGKLLKDYHTARTFDGSQSFVSNRYYLSDAIFLVGLEADDEVLHQWEEALRSPAFPLFLGRRSCPPVMPLVLGVRQGVSLADALEQEPWIAACSHQRLLRREAKVSLEIVKDAIHGEPDSYLIDDLPETFDQTYRRYTTRSVKNTLNAVVVENPCHQTDLVETTHDALSVVEEVR